MNKGSRAAAPMSMPVEGKKDTSKPAGPGKVVPSMMPAGRMRNISKKGLIIIWEGVLDYE
jgi:hypothetical protein